MTDAAVTLHEFRSFDRGRLSQRHTTRTVAGAAALAFSLVAGAWIMHALPRAARTVEVPPVRPAPLARAALPAPPVPATLDITLLDPAFSLGPAPLALADSIPLAARFVPLARPAPVILASVLPAAAVPPATAVPPAAPPHDAAPLPPPAPVADRVPLPVPASRPPLVGGMANREPARPGRRQMARAVDTAPAPPADDRGFFEKFFGLSKPSGPALAYASPEDGLFGRSRALPAAPASRDRWTAVYDISAHTVYMPDGARLEAHSGLGDLIDDPRHADAPNRGATPPHVYDLQLRESLFHGVQALRLNPVGGSGVFGRTGLLAHTFMLGPKGDSNGCVSFRDYAAFLRAYQNGQVRRLVVVAGQ